jgi:hypothetical protein
MTKARQAMLNATVHTFGHEHPFTIEIFKVSERLPEQEFDCIVLIILNARQTEYFNEPDYDDLEEDFTIQTSFDNGFIHG